MKGSKYKEIKEIKDRRLDIKRLKALIKIVN
jgi:hypothetical protein